MLVLRGSLASRFADALDAKAFEVGLEALSMGEALALISAWCHCSLSFCKIASDLASHRCESEGDAQLVEA
jgi:hypothetical protein